MSKALEQVPQSAPQTWEAESKRGIELFKKGSAFFAEAQKCSVVAKAVAAQGDAAKTEEVNGIVQSFYQNAIAALVESSNALEGALELNPETDPNHIKIQKNLATVTNTLGTVMFAIGEYKEAIGVFRSALKINPTLPEAQRNLAKALNSEGLKLYDEGEAAKSIETMKAAIDLFKEALNISKTVAWASPEQASSEIASVTKNLCTTLNNLAVAMDAHGLPVTDTLPLLVEAANLKFDDAAIKNIAGMLNNHALESADKGQWAEALEMIHEACKLNPSEEAVWKNCHTLVTGAHEAGHGDLVGTTQYHGEDLF